MMVTKAYGISIEYIDESCPAELSPYKKMHETEMKEKDAYIHAWIGEYGISALTVAIDGCLNGRKSTAKYVKYPILERAEFEEKDKQKQRELFVASLMTMKTNFELNHPKKEAVKIEQKSD